VIPMQNSIANTAPKEYVEAIEDSGVFQKQPF
jgi:hypothetical protein